ncbi:MAG: HTH domain-containing protein [Planctomycetota bacterium]|nr:HTH domain-containing protein [Planctomycetota bacterium]
MRNRMIKARCDPQDGLDQDQVVQCLRRDQVAQGAQLAAQLELSQRTVQRALAKVGYYTSLKRLRRDDPRQL